MNRGAKIVSAVALLAAAFGLRSGTPALAADTPGAVYAMTNDPTHNEIVVFNRAADGTLAPAGAYETGGTGSGSFEQSGNGLILGEQAPNNLNGGYHYLYATNAGSNSISVFAVKSDGLTLVSTTPSGGLHPISVTVHRHVLYVLNAGDVMCTGSAPSITGFTVDAQGALTPIPGSTRPLSGNPVSGCSQVSFDPSGQVLVVSERLADKLDTYLVDKDGVANGPIVNETTGYGPFGFSFTQRGQLLTAENFGAVPLQGGAASYDINNDGTLTPNGPTARDGRSDTCWLVNTDNGKYAYTTNFGTGDISSFQVNPDGTLVLLNPTAGTTSGPTGASDEAFSGDSHYLYARNAVTGTIDVFSVASDGSLIKIQTVVAALPGGAGIGIAVK